MLRGTLAAAGLAALLLPAARAGTGAEGRWEGSAHVPGAPLPVVLDLALVEGRLAAWVTLPGRGIKGMALRAPLRTGSRLEIDLSPAFSLTGPPSPSPRLVLEVAPQVLRGRFEQAGHEAPVALVRTGAAQPEPVPRNSVLPAALAGVWRGRYDIAGTPREVTLTLAPASAEAVIVGRRTTHVPMDRIRLGEQFLTLDNDALQITIEGRWRTAGGEIDAVFTQGPYEAPLVLRRQVPR